MYIIHLSLQEKFEDKIPKGQSEAVNWMTDNTIQLSIRAYCWILKSKHYIDGVTPFTVVYQRKLIWSYMLYLISALTYDRHHFCHAIVIEYKIHVTNSFNIILSLKYRYLFTYMTSINANRKISSRSWRIPAKLDS